MSRTFLDAEEGQLGVPSVPRVIHIIGTKLVELETEGLALYSDSRLLDNLFLPDPPSPLHLALRLHDPRRQRQQKIIVLERLEGTGFRCRRERLQVVSELEIEFRSLALFEMIGLVHDGFGVEILLQRLRRRNPLQRSR